MAEAKTWVGWAWQAVHFSSAKGLWVEAMTRAGLPEAFRFDGEVGEEGSGVAFALALGSGTPSKKMLRVR
jgi:hypothetical protein